MGYELGTKHHHIQCRKCGKDLEIKHEVIDFIYAQLEQLSGFQLDSSHLTFLGLCPECQ
jgi:Fe2+ or Zn2+ uptake regulation protein